MLGAEYVELPELLRESDFVSLHCPLTEQTYHMIGEKELHSMKPTAILINTARGPVCDEEVLARALQQGIIRGLRWMYSPGNRKPTVRCFHARMVILTPHIATFTRDAFVKMNNMAAQSIIDWLEAEG